LHDITVQPWSPSNLASLKAFSSTRQIPGTEQKIDEIAAAHNVTNTTIAIAWLLRHPAHMQPSSARPIRSV